MTRGSAVPSGLACYRSVPNAEALGYFRMSLRDRGAGPVIERSDQVPPIVRWVCSPFSGPAGSRVGNETGPGATCSCYWGLAGV